MSQPEHLTKRVQAIYNFICEYFDVHGYPPSVREIGSAVGLKSPSTVHMHLQTLEQKNLIKRRANKSRTIELCEHVHENFVQPEFSDRDVLRLPLVGQVAAGSPILAEENIEEYYALPSSIVGDTSTFMLQVRGDSMINVGIFDGDYLAVTKTSVAENGQIVVALIEDSATVKTFYKEQNRIRLQPENDAMEPIYADNPIILGRVTALIRSIR